MPEPHRIFQAECFSLLGDGGPMHVVDEHPAGQEIDALVPQLSGTGAGQDEYELSGFEEIVHFIKEIRNPLDFVDDDPAFVCIGDERTQLPRICRQPVVEPRLQQVDEQCTGQLLLEPGGFPRAQGAEQEEALPTLQRFFQEAGEQLAGRLWGPGRAR